MAWNTKSARVISNEENSGTEEVFDIEMPRRHNFFANGVLAHNCHEVDYTNLDCQYMKIINDLLRRNPKLRIVGFTGSPYRGSEDILGRFWVDCVYRVRTPYLVDRGYLVPTIFGFGHDEIRYDLHEWQTPDVDDHSDFTRAELLAMQRKITADSTVTEKIMGEVVALTSNRNAVMITGAGKKHLEQIAECLPTDSWVIITDQTGSKERRESLKAVSRGEKKYLLQIGCLTTGYDEARIDTSVLMRKIGSLTLLIQLLGRGMRLLKPRHIEAGIKKEDHLVLDYTDTMAEMADKYHNPILEQADEEKARKQDDQLITCPACNTENSPRARRCRHRPEDPEKEAQRCPPIEGRPNYSIDGRCEWFWSGNDCPGCGIKNDSTARECRSCGKILYDPNKNLAGKHYTDDDWRAVRKMFMQPTKNQEGLVVTYLLEGPPEEGEKTYDLAGEQLAKASEVFWPRSPHKWAQAVWRDKFLKQHLHRGWWGRVQGKHPGQIAKMGAMFDVPSHITHRVKDDGKSIIHRKRFLSGREAQAAENHK